MLTNNDSSLKQRISNKLLAKNTLYNLIGQGLPIIIAIFTIPILISELGTEKFGILTIAWMVIGYFSLFDFGIGRALIHLISEKLGSNEKQQIPGIIWTASILLIFFGFMSTILIYLITPWLVNDFLKITPQYIHESLVSFYILSFSIPIVISATAFRGILEAYQRFDLVNIVRIPMGIITYLGPLVVLPFSNSLIYVTLILVIARFLLWGLNLIMCIKLEPETYKKIKFEKRFVKPLLNYGGWMTVSNIVSPIMSNMDRFLIGYLLTVSVVAFYTTPYEIVSKFAIIPMALVSVLFPAFSMYYKQNQNKLWDLYKKGLIWTFLIMYPIVLITVSLSKEGISLWIDPDFARKSALILQILAIGMLVNSLAYTPYSLIQGCGRPDITAKLHIVELIVYIAIMIPLTQNMGIVGAALAWTIRVVLDGVVLLLFSKWLFFKRIEKKKIGLKYMVLLTIPLFIFFFNLTLMLKLTIMVICLILFLYLSWYVLLKKKLF